MRILDTASLPEIAMRQGMRGRWIADRERGTTAVAVLENVVEPGVAAPRHTHAFEELILVQQGRLWVEIAGERATVAAGQAVVIPANTAHAWGNDAGDTMRLLFVWPEAEPFAPGKSTYLEGLPPVVR